MGPAMPSRSLLRVLLGLLFSAACVASFRVSLRAVLHDGREEAPISEESRGVSDSNFGAAFDSHRFGGLLDHARNYNNVSSLFEKEIGVPNALGLLEFL